MAILQGSSYKMPIVIKGSNGEIIEDTVIQNASFTFGNLVKTYGNNGEVYFEDGKWIIPLSEEETFSLRGIIKWQARFHFVDGSVDGTLPKSEEIYSSIDKTKFTGGIENA